MIFPKCQEISLARIFSGLSMRELARRAGINIGTVSRLESSRQSVTPKTAKAICDALNRNLNDLFLIDLEDHKNESTTT
ncbi:MAG: XRE family transcriptional regulator [Oscillospiraceae bacterium]|nr:MAG: XRE family transcriptional regulator [Oscillospiraceae bacterium]